MYFSFFVPYSRHGSASVDPNPLPSTERSTAAVQTVVSDSPPCPVPVQVNDQRPHDHQHPANNAATEAVAAAAADVESPRDPSPAKGTNKTETVLATSSARPICPNLPYSPACSPRFARRRPPLRECRVSVNVQSLDDPKAHHQKLNQYKLIDSIGQVCVESALNTFGQTLTKKYSNKNPDALKKYFKTRSKLKKKKNASSCDRIRELYSKL